ncbi:MAG: tetratricopeptide repeat protein [Armatimonadetes bacterium]|nr:tetratricopeptide repeat protein [Armatimonadota bacterium]
MSPITLALTCGVLRAGGTEQSANGERQYQEAQALEAAGEFDKADDAYVSIGHETRYDKQWRSRAWFALGQLREREYRIGAIFGYERCVAMGYEDKDGQPLLEARFRAACLLARCGDSEKAHKLADSFRAATPQLATIFEANEEYYRAWSSGTNWAQKAELYKSAMQKGAGTRVQPMAQMGLAVCYEQLGNTEAMLLLLETIVRENKDRETTPVALDRLGRYWDLKGSQPKAITAFNRILDEFPTSRLRAGAFCALAQMHERQGNLGEAEHALTRWLEESKKMNLEQAAQAGERLGAYYARHGREKEAFAALRSGWEGGKGFPEGMLRMADYLIEQKRFSEAIGILREVIRGIEGAKGIHGRSLTCFDARLSIAAILCEHKAFVEAVVECQKAMMECPYTSEHFRAAWQIADAWDKAGELAKALVAYKDAIQKYPDMRSDLRDRISNRVKELERGEQGKHEEALQK